MSRLCFFSIIVALLSSVDVVLAQGGSSGSGGVTVTVPGVSVTGGGVDAGVRVLGSEIVGVHAGVANPPVPQPTAPKTTLPDMFMALEQNLAAALAGLNAILASPNHTPAQVAAQQAVIETLRSLKDSMGRAITPAAPAKPATGQ